MNDFPLISKKLPSGLRTLLLPRSEGETVTFLILIGVGSRYETSQQSGLSHFLEHMFFKGTEKRPDKKDIAEALDNIGAEFNAFTGDEVTGYYVKVAKEHLELGADVVSDILLHSLFPVEEIERERGVIIEEIRMYTDSPMQHVQNLWRKTLFGDHPLGRRIDGAIETVSKFKRSDFVSYTGRHYHAGNAVVAVAGNFDTDKTTKLLKSLFKEIPRGGETTPRQAPKKLPKQRFVNEQRLSLDQTHLIVGVPGVGINDKQRWAAELLSVILGGGMSSRLFMLVREKHGLAYAVRTSSDNFFDTGALATQAGLRTDKADFALKLILGEYDRVMNKVVPAKELDKAKSIVRGHMVIDLEETNALAMFAGGQEIFRKKVMAPSDIWKKIEAVSVQDIQTVAQELLVPNKRSVALLSPHKSVSSFEKLIHKE
jgi:predicted Zn-dependent peptidase